MPSFLPKPFDELGEGGGMRFRVLPATARARTHHIVERDAILFEGPLIPGEAHLATTSMPETSNEADSPMSNIQQVLHHLLRRRHIIAKDERRRLSLIEWGDQNDRSPLLPQEIQYALMFGEGRCQHNAVHARTA